MLYDMNKTEPWYNGIISVSGKGTLAQGKLSEKE